MNKVDKSQKITWWYTIKSFLPYLWIKDTNFRIRVILSAFFIVATIVLNLLIPLILKNIIKYFDYKIVPVHLVHVLLMTYAVCWVLVQLAIIFREVVVFQVIRKSIHLLSYQIFSHLYGLSLRFHATNQITEIQEAIEKTEESLPDLYWGIFVIMAPSFVELTMAIIILWNLYGIPYAGVLFVVAVLYALISTFGTQYLIKAQQASVKVQNQAREQLNEGVSNIETVKYFSNVEHEQQQAEIFLQNIEETLTKRDLIGDIIQFLQMMVLGTGLLIVTWWTGNNVMKGTMTAGDFVLINGYLLQFVQPLAWFGRFFRKIRRGFADLNNMLKLLTTKPEVNDVQNALEFQSNYAHVEFKNVSFTYENKEVLHDISFKIPAGSYVAILGQPGSGKTTLVRLLFRFYDVTSGQILINDHDIRSITQRSLHEMIGIVPQETVIFNNTLAYNIAYGNVNADKQEIDYAVQKTGLQDLVVSLPQGLDTLVGEKGFKLSNLDKQRVAIARILLKKPLLYVFDEVIENLVEHDQVVIQNLIDSIAQGNTALLLTHLPEIAKHAEHVIVLENGKIVDY